MQLQLTDSELAFQQKVRDFLKRVYTTDLARRINSHATFKQASVEWQKELFNQGWIAPSWPQEFGGTGWSITEKFIFSNELAAIGAPEVQPFGVKMVGPVIYTFASDAQKEKFLPSILNSDTWWCQGYSEPGAGSDLSALRLKAEKTSGGKNYTLNGSKIWTTYAQHADWIFCLVRTDNSGKPQQGISFLLIDMKTPGISVRPIITIDAEHHLNEVIFEDVEVPVENLIGEEGQGWSYAKFLLNNERGTVAGVSYCKGLLGDIKNYATKVQSQEGLLINNPFFQQRLADAEIELMALECTELRALEKIKNKQDAPTDASILKILGTELQQTLQSLYMEVAGVFSGVINEASKDPELYWGHSVRKEYLFGRAATVYAGSNEIQRNIIAKMKFSLL